MGGSLNEWKGVEMVDRQVRVIERWGLLAGVTGVAANVLLVALYLSFAFPMMWASGWTGPANDVVGGIVSTGATIPVALELGKLAGGRSLVRAATVLAVAMAAIAVTSALLVVDLIAYERQVFVAIPAVAIMFIWTAVTGWSGVATRLLPSRLAQLAVAIGLAGSAGMMLATGSLLFGIPAFLTFPVWLIALSNRLRAHLAQIGDIRLFIDDPTAAEAAETVSHRRAR
jgi:hypothetical protein